MLMNTITSQSKKWRGYLLTHFGSPTGAAGAASCTAADPAHDACLQQLLSPGVQTVQLLHDSWDSNSHVIVMAHQCRINIGCHGQNVWFIYIIQSPTQVKTLSALKYPVLCGLLYTARSALQRSPRLCATWTHFKNMSNRFDVSNTLETTLTLFPEDTLKSEFKQRGGLVLKEINSVCHPKNTYKLYQR